MELSDSRPDDDMMTTEATMPPMMFAEAESGAAVRSSDLLDAIVCADCLKFLPELPDKSVDAVITDPPYGMTACEWDTLQDWPEWWRQIWRVCRGVVVMTAANPFAADMVTMQRARFKYEWVWDKSWATGGQNADKRPMRAHELVLVFGSGKYNPQMREVTPDERARMRKQDATCKTAAVHGNGNNVSPGWYEGRKKHPTTVLDIPALAAWSEERAGHPTQKPSSLMRYLVETYTDAKDVVLDPFAGSGSTLVAAKQSGRHWLGIEKEQLYADTTKTRLAQEMCLGV